MMQQEIQEIRCHHGTRDLIEPRHVHLQWQYAPADRFNLACQLPSRFHISQSECHISPSMSKS